MAEQWISARQVLELGFDRRAVCTRLHKGLMQAHATELHRKYEQTKNGLLPKQFWWAEGESALEQNWESGDFSTFVSSNDEWKAFGVRFPLSGLLEMRAFEERPEILRSLSVAGNPLWVSAKDARQIVYANGIQEAGRHLLEQARLGFVAGKAVEAFGVANPNNFMEPDWEEREWEIPLWFWGGFASPSGQGTNWELGSFGGEGISPIGSRLVELSGVHFHRGSVEACFPSRLLAAQDGEKSRGGRRPKYDWPKAVVAVYGLIERGELKPQVQADIERALVIQLTDGDDGPDESTARPFAKLIWDESRKP